MAVICVREEAVMFLVRLHLELIFSSSWNIDQQALFQRVPAGFGEGLKPCD